MVGVAALFGDEPGCTQGGHLHTQPHQGLTMRVEIIGIAHAVALDIWTVGILWIWPPVVAFGKVIVLAASASRTLGRRDGDGSFTDILVGRLENSRTVDGFDVETILASKPIGDREARKGQKVTAVHIKTLPLN